MPVSEFDQWVEYDTEEPFGQPWDNWLMAVQGHLFASANTAKGKTAPTIESFFYKGKSDRVKAVEDKADVFVNFLEGKRSGD